LPLVNIDLIYESDIIPSDSNLYDFLKDKEEQSLQIVVSPKKVAVGFSLISKLFQAPQEKDSPVPLKRQVINQLSAKDMLCNVGMTVGDFIRQMKEDNPDLKDYECMLPESLPILNIIKYNQHFFSSSADSLRLVRVQFPSDEIMPVYVFDGCQERFQDGRLKDRPFCFIKRILHFFDEFILPSILEKSIEKINKWKEEGCLKELNINISNSQPINRHFMAISILDVLKQTHYLRVYGPEGGGSINRYICISSVKHDHESAEILYQDIINNGVLRIGFVNSQDKDKRLLTLEELMENNKSEIMDMISLKKRKIVNFVV